MTKQTTYQESPQNAPLPMPNRPEVARPRSVRISSLLCLALSLLGFQPRALATPPAAPTDVTATTLGVNVWTIAWNDAATDEDAFRIEGRVTGGDPNWVDVVGSDLSTPNQAGTGPLSFNVILNEFNNFPLEFRVIAVKNGPPEELSISPIAQAAATPATTTYGAPSGLVATPSDGSVSLTWVDNSNSEHGFELESRVLPSGSFSSLGSVSTNQNVDIVASGLDPDTGYEFRVRAVKGGASPTAWSAVASTTTLSLQPPSNVVATVSNERDIGFTLDDNSTAEDGFFIDYRVSGETTWSRLGSLGANTNSVNPITNVFDPATAYEFRFQAFVGTAESPTATSGDSNIASASTLFNAPSGLTASPLTDSSIQLNWTDNSAIEGGIGVYMREGTSGPFELVTFAATDSTSSTVEGLSAGTTYQFEVTSAFQTSAPTDRGIVESTASSTATGSTRDGMTSPVYVEGRPSQAFNYTLTTTAVSTVNASSITSLPTGLSYDSGTQSITGSPASAGVFECPVSISFADGWTFNSSLTIRILAPPAPGSSPLLDQLISPTTNSTFNLDLAFTDPDADSGVEMVTSEGSITLALFDATTPNTVTNFLTYANASDYDNTVFHRSVSNFVVQGGAFRPDPGTGPDAFTAVPTRSPVVNEPGLSNVRGTMAMAKLGGDPNSATNQFFFSTNNNGPNLNNQNGGFTVFGRVINEDMSVVDAIAALPVGTYGVDIDGGPTTLSDFPLDAASAPASMDNSLVVSINSVTPIPQLTYSVVSNSNPGVVTASIGGGSLILSPLSTGTSTLVVQATDLDGNSAQQSFTVNTSYAYSFWAEDSGLTSGNNGPTQNPDTGGLVNLAEFGLMGDPLLNDDASVTPTASLYDDGGTDRLSLTFNMRKDAELIFRVLANSGLDAPGWSEIWHSETDGLGATNVAGSTDQGTHYEVQIFDSAPPPSDTRFLKVEISEAP